MRTYGKNSAGQWVEIGQTPYIWLATLIQNLRLIQGESPFYNTAGIPAYNSVKVQIAPTIAVNNIRKLFAPQFNYLSIVATANAPNPTYNVQAVLSNGAVFQQIAS